MESFEFIRPEPSECEHNYAEKTCPKCKTIFCYDCCKGTNVDQGGKYAPDYMNCPNCGHDYYSEE